MDLANLGSEVNKLKNDYKKSHNNFQKIKMYLNKKKKKNQMVPSKNDKNK